MRHKWLTALCTAVLLVNSTPFVHADDPAEHLVSVGLAFGDTALDGANLKNEIGSGYQFGYLDQNRNFQQVGYTDHTDLSVVVTQNVCYGRYGDYTSYSQKITSDVTVGCWHVQLPLNPATYEEALEGARNSGGFPAWIDGTYQIRVGAFTTREEAESAAVNLGGSAVGTSAYGVSVVATGTSSVLFQFDGGDGLSLTVVPLADPSVKPVTWFKGYRYFGWFQYRRVGGGALVVSNILPLEDYINCVISREMSASWPLEALKAQAVCARTYYEINLGRHNAQGFDICGTTHCQAYYGMASTDENTARAAAETSGKRAWYMGKPAQTYYYSSNGGGSEDVRNVWPGNEAIPYLCGVIDPYEALVEDKIKGYRWTVEYTGSELADILRQSGYAAAEIQDVKLELTPTGNVKRITLIDKNGKSWPFTKEKRVRNMFKLKSMHYEVITPGGNTSAQTVSVMGGGTLSTADDLYAVNGQGSVGLISVTPHIITASGTRQLNSGSGPSGKPDVFKFSGAGWGHNVGMSQWGAYSMAEQGKAYDEILQFYYPGIEIY